MTRIELEQELTKHNWFEIEDSGRWKDSKHFRFIDLFDDAIFYIIEQNDICVASMLIPLHNIQTCDGWLECYSGISEISFQL